eukprot:13728371-Ditylum_brightwellii.AAC.1
MQDYKGMVAFSRYSDQYPSPEGLKLKEEANMQLEYYKEMKALQKFDIKGWVKPTKGEEKEDN